MRRFSTRFKVISICIVGIILLWILRAPSDTFGEVHSYDALKSGSQTRRKSMSMVIMKTETNALPKDERLFQSAEEEEFPTVPGDSFRIPHIIHQIFTDENIPLFYVPMIESFVRNNPSWQYMFWTYEDGRKLINRTHPYLLRTYDKLTAKNGVMKSDILRLVLLYEFGGMYADLDVLNLRPLDIATKKYACIFPVEPFEHAAVYRMKYVIGNGIILCRPKHPFIKFCLKHLENVNEHQGPVAVTGPAFLTRMFDDYNNITVMHKENTIKTDMSSNSPSFYKGELPEDDDNAVYVPNSQYFMDNLSLSKKTTIVKVCSNRQANMSHLLERACIEFISRQNVRKNRKYTITVHYWFSLWVFPENCLKGITKVHIDSIVQDRVIVN